MKIRDFPQLQGDLHEVLYDLAKAQSSELRQNIVVDRYVQRFEAIYIDGFRHQYSSLYDLVVQVAQGGDNDIEAFLEKLDIVLMRLDDKGSKAKLNFFKLYDHLSLDINFQYSGTNSSNLYL